MRILNCLTLGALLGVALLTGCEEDTNLSGADFRIDPPEATISETDGSVALRVIGGAEPFEWTVSDDTLGAVSGSGSHVTYTRTGQGGVNTVTVTDDRSWTASALMVQQNQLAVSPTTATTADEGDKIIFQASGGRPPYSWSTTAAWRGSVAPQGANQAIYTRTDSGENQVLVTDSQGTVAIATVTQPGDDEDEAVAEE